MICARILCTKILCGRLDGRGNKAGQVDDVQMMSKTGQWSNVFELVCFVCGRMFDYTYISVYDLLKCGFSEE